MSEEALFKAKDVISSPPLYGASLLDSQLWRDVVNMYMSATGPQSIAGRSLPSAITPYFDSATGNFDSASGNFDEGGLGSLTWTKPLSTPVTGLHEQYLTANEVVVFVGYLTAIYKWGSAASPENVTRSSGAYTGYEDQSIIRSSTRWSFASWVDYTVATNGVDDPQYYTGSGDFSSLSDATSIHTTIEIFRALGPHMLGIATGLSRRGFGWCKENDITVWNSATHATAGAKVIRELTGDIVCAQPLGEYIAVYSSNEMALIEYVGPPFYFGAKVAITGIGATGKNAVAVVGRKHIGFSLDGIWETDGVDKRYVTPASFRIWLHSNLNKDQLSKVAAVHDVKNHSIRFSFPRSGSNNNDRELLYNYMSGAISFGTLFGTVYSAMQKFGHALQGLNGGDLVLLCEGLDDYDGTAVQCYIQSKPMDFGEKNYRKFIDFAIATLDIISGSGVDFQWAATETPEAALTWSTTVTANELAEIIAIVSPDRPFFHFRFLSQATNASWVLHDLELYGDVTSRVS